MQEYTQRIVKEYVCQDCGDKYTFAEFLFKSLANPYNCPSCERDHYNEALND